METPSRIFQPGTPGGGFSSRAVAGPVRVVSRHGSCKLLRRVLYPSSTRSNRLGPWPRCARAGNTITCRVTLTSAPVRIATRQVLSFTRYVEAGVTVEVAKNDGTFEVNFTAEPARPMVLHWAVEDWKLAPKLAWPAYTKQFDDKAVQTPFKDGEKVIITFDESSCPSKMVFVLKETAPERWINLHASDFTTLIKVPRLSDVINEVFDAETMDPHFCLHHRFKLALELVDGAAASGREAMALILVWLRLSSLKQLPWYSRATYTTAEMTEVEAALASKLAEKARSASDPVCRNLARMALSCVPRGSNNGEEIVNCMAGTMKDHGIRQDANDKGVDEPFLRQWQNKLRTSCSPEDIALCRAYLAFQQSGEVADFWNTALERGGITPAYLAAMDPAITALPKKLPQLVLAMQHLLWLLRVAHTGPDLELSLQMAQHCLDDKLKYDIQDALKNPDQWWIPGKIVEIRERLMKIWKGPTSRDVLMLDIALDRWFRTTIGNMDLENMNADQQVELLNLVLQNACLAADSDDFAKCLVYWQKVASQERWTSTWSQVALAATERLQSTLGHQADTIYSLVTPHAQRFSRHCAIPESYVTDRFGEDLVRGQSAFAVSLLLKSLIPQLRKAAGVSSWWVVSQSEEDVVGEVQVLPSLARIQGRVFDKPQVVVVKKLSSKEEIPEGVVAVLTRRGTEVLSHAAIRARARGILLASCIDTKEIETIIKLKGRTVRLALCPDGAVVPTELNQSNSAPANGGSKRLGPLSIPTPAFTPSWALKEDAFREGLVGAKSWNLTELRRWLPPHLSVPTSVALPFRTFERTLAHIGNARTAAVVAEELRKLELFILEGDRGMPKDALQTLRHTVANDLQAPDELRNDLANTAAAVGLIDSPDAWSRNSSQWQGVWQAITKVWASKWNERAWASRRERSIEERQLNIACTLQKIVPAQYAFVLHTSNPVTKQRGEVFGEVVVGLGESLVGNHHGRALSFTSKLHEGQPPKVLCLPSKRAGFFLQGRDTIIARSDSNGEDLAEYSGAGLYDSVLATPLLEASLDYTHEPLLWDEGFRSYLMKELTDAARIVEQACRGTPQDIEGVWKDGKITIVQSRAQQLL